MTQNIHNYYTVQIISPLQHAKFIDSFNLNNLDRDTSQVILDQVEWTDETSARLEDLLSSNATSICLNVSDMQVYYKISQIL